MNSLRLYIAGIAFVLCGFVLHFSTVRSETISLSYSGLVLLLIGGIMLLIDMTGAVETIKKFIHKKRRYRQ